MKKRFWSFLLVLCLVTSLLPAAALAAAPRITYAQKAENARTVTAAVSDPAAADSVKLTAAMSNDGKVTESVTIEKKLDASGTFDFELPYFGKWDITAAFSKGGRDAGTSKGTAALKASEYNIVLGAATTDVLVESLQLFIGEEMDTSVPTIITLDRAQSYNWSRLPENSFRNPLLTAEQNAAPGSWAEQKVPAMQAYVAQLHALDEAAVFHFYIGDSDLQSFPLVSFGNGLKQDNYTLTMVTEGSATYSGFKAVYDGIDDAAAKHTALVDAYKTFREGVINGTVKPDAALPSGPISRYAYAILDAEPGARWWVVLKSRDTFGLQDPDFQDSVLNDTRISNNLISNLLARLDDAGRSDAFQALYNFDDTDFRNARETGRKIMMMLGTSLSAEKEHPPLPYMQFVAAYYGNAFSYFYKGHPGNYESNSPENTARCKSINVGMLEPSIAAELFIFFNPDICVSGYESSLFQNMGDDSQDFALWRRTKDVAYADGTVGTYAARMEMFLSDLTVPEDTHTFADAEDDTADMKAAKKAARAAREMLLALVPEAEKSDRNYMVEFNNTEDKTVSQYDYAIWNYSNSLIHYIGKDTDGKYAIVSTVSAKGCDGGDDCPSKMFKDVDQSLWYHDYVDYAVRNGLFDGTSDTTFEPDSTMTRGMLATVLHRMEGKPAASKASPFVDLVDDWYKNAVNWAAETGIVDGMDETHFVPNENITREQAMTMLMRYARYKGMDVSATIELKQFTDASSISDWADAAVRWAVATGLINGVTDTTIVPQGDSTRAQIAAILMRFQTNRV